MARSTRPRLAVRLYNGAHHLLAAAGRAPSRFDETELLESASRAAGLDDFGDPGSLDGLRTLVGAYNEEARLSPFGRTMVRGELLGILQSRLAVVDALRRDPDLRRAPIRRPVFVLGLPRTGTTAFHELLAQDPGNQALDYWLAAAPGPRPAPDRVVSDPRYKKAEQFLRITYYLDPSLRAIHNLTPDGPDECRHLLQESFTDDTFDSNATIPSYTRWYAERDMRPSYAHHADVLRLIQSTCSDRRWVLKYPAHLRHLDVLLETYPDACIVQTHRDPARVLPSLCSLVSNWRGIYEESVDPVAVGRWQLDMWASHMEHAMAVRSAADPARFCDVHFDEVVADPVSCIARVYRHFGMPFTDEARGRMQSWHASHPRGRFGGHEARAGDFGLDRGAMTDVFAGYCERFGVAAEG